jgi:hypothetical protein
MNCFEARNDFVAFWQRTLLPDRQVELLAHLRECSSCDHSFRVFALTAPLLYSRVEPARGQASDDVSANLPANRIATPLRAGELSGPPANKRHLIVRVMSRAIAASMLAAAAAIALYFAAPPRMTFEDAIGSDYSNLEPASYPSVDSFFGKALVAEDTANQDFSDE